MGWGKDHLIASVHLPHSGHGDEAYAHACSEIHNMIQNAGTSMQIIAGDFNVSISRQLCPARVGPFVMNDGAHLCNREQELARMLLERQLNVVSTMTQPFMMDGEAQ